MKPIKKKEECKHKWEIAYTSWQFPRDYACVGIIEYAYWCCKKCLAVKKVEVK